MREFDFIVLGSGIAGLSFALKAAKVGSVALITKRGRADSNTAWAQGGVAAVLDPGDTFSRHAALAPICDAGPMHTERGCQFRG